MIEISCTLKCDGCSVVTPGKVVLSGPSITFFNFGAVQSFKADNSDKWVGSMGLGLTGRIFHDEDCRARTILKERAERDAALKAGT